MLALLESSGSLCIVCQKAPAPTERQYRHRCKACVAGVDPRTHYAIVKAESNKVLRAMSESQTWDGSEPSLQLLVLTQQREVPLPSYDKRPRYLRPMHCRLCLAEFESQDLVDFDGLPCARSAFEALTAFQLHLLDRHGMGLRDYQRGGVVSLRR